MRPKLTVLWCLLKAGITWWDLAPMAMNGRIINNDFITRNDTEHPLSMKSNATVY